MHQKIKNLSIRLKLRLAFGTIIVLCMVAAVIGAFGIGTVFTSSRTLYNDFGQSQGTVNRLLADFKQNELLTGLLLLNPTKESAAYTERVLTVLTEQSEVLKQIDLGLEQISAVIQNNSAASEQSAAASQQLYAQSTELERHVKVFSVE